MTNICRRLESGAATYHDMQLLLILLSESEAMLRECINKLDLETAARAMLVQRRLQEVFDED